MNMYKAAKKVKDELDSYADGKKDKSDPRYLELIWMLYNFTMFHNAKKFNRTEKETE